MDVYYEPFAVYQRGNFSSIGTGILNINVSMGLPTENDYSLYWEMITARQLLTGTNTYYIEPSSNPQVQIAPPPGQIPLWRWDNRDGGRPLLAVSPGPFLYPFSGIFYLCNLTFFAAFHFWLALLGTFLLSTYFPEKIKMFGRPLLLFLVVIILPQLRFDLAAGWSWWMMGLALALSLAAKRFPIKLTALSFIFAMLWLAVSPPLSVILISTLAVWWRLVARWKNNWRVSSLFEELGGVVLGAVIGALLSGPQLFPRLFDRMEPYKLPPYQTPAYLPAPVSLNRVTRVCETEIVYNLTIEENSSPTELTIPERYDPGWTADYRTNSASLDYQPLPLNRTEQGWRSITLPVLPRGTIVEVRTTFNPTSFRIGVWCFLGGLVAWLFITGFALYPGVTKSFSYILLPDKLKFSAKN